MLGSSPSLSLVLVAHMASVPTFALCFMLGRLGGSCCGMRSVEGPSMEPTLRAGQVLWTLSFDCLPVQLLFASRIMALNGRIVTAALGQGTTFCKRAVAVPSDDDMFPERTDHPVEGVVWLLGDNTEASYDSRNIGAVPLSCIRDVAIAVVWPPDSIRLL